MSKHRGGMWEEPEWELQLDVEVAAGGGIEPCKHSGEIEVREVKNERYGATFRRRFFRCPRVIVATNEGGQATTGICADCVLEALAEEAKD